MKFGADNLFKKLRAIRNIKRLSLNIAFSEKSLRYAKFC